MSAWLGHFCRAFVACLLLSLGAPAHAQITNETIVNNHPTTSTYQRSYTPAAGSNRVVIAIVFSEYRSDQNSGIISATLGGKAMTYLGTIEATQAKKNRMTALLMREQDLPNGTANLRVTYGPDPAASLIYIATVLNVDQASAVNPPIAFERLCYTTGANNSGRLRFGAVSAQANDYVFSFVGTGDADTLATFNNGGTEIFDERVTGPGFSFAGAVQSPPAAQTLTGDVSVSEGCNRRPSTFQLVLRPFGTDAIISSPATQRIGTAIPAEVTDADRNIRSAVVDTVTVYAVNQSTNEVETLTLTETGPNTGIFRATVPTIDAAQGPNNNGTMSARVGHVVRFWYQDVINTSGSSRWISSDTQLTGVALLVATKRSELDRAQDTFRIPGSEPLYIVEIRNTGNGPTDADSMFVLDTLPPEVTFRTDDLYANDGVVSPVNVQFSFTGMTFDPATDLRYSNLAAKPASLANCTYTPTAGLDPNIRHVCIRPRGQMPAASPNPVLAIRFRTAIK